jgi:fucose 4-O-acetylase-like acetyltransferase
VPSPSRGRFPFFPCGAYIGFGIATGAIVKRTAAERLDRLMQWFVLAGFALVFGAQYFSNLPYSVYTNADFWRNSPGLILIRVGVVLLLLAGAYLWCAFRKAGAWSWVENFGKTSLLVYWVHVMLVYGTLTNALHRSLTIPQAALATGGVILLMIVLSEIRLRWQAKRVARWKSGTTVAGAPA